MSETTLQTNFLNLKNNLPQQVELVAVSKTHPVTAIQEVYDCGQRKFGENRVQELTEKQPELPNDIQWHLIGHLQTNKVKYIAPFISLIESVDSEKLLREIDRQAEKYNRQIDVLLQIKIADEDAKTGMETEDALEILKHYDTGEFPHVKIKGFMGMATFTENQEQLRKEFLFLNDFYNSLKEKYHFEILSMGMSSDYELAVECGSTSVRVGSAIFGHRN